MTSKTENILIGCCIVVSFLIGRGFKFDEDKKDRKAFEKAITECSVEVAKKNGEIELELMYRCNNNYCVNYGRHYYLFQCVTSKMEAK